MPPSEKELVMYQKATVLDLLQIFKKEKEKTYTPEEMEEIMLAYIKGLEEK